MAKRRKLTEEIILKLRLRMLKHAAANFHRDPEDIASEYVTRLLEGLHTRATVAQAFVDICRLSDGRKGTTGYDSRRTLRIVAGSDAQADRAQAQAEPEKDVSQEEKTDLKLILSKIKDDRTKWIFNKLLKGFTLKEIGIELGVSESRVSQIVQEETIRLRNLA